VPSPSSRRPAEAEAWQGPSLVIAYSHCIEHGIDMAQGMAHQVAAVKSGYWPLWRFDPRKAEAGEHPFVLDSKAPTIALKEFQQTEARFAMLARVNPERAEKLLHEAQDDVKDRWHYYEQLADVEREVEHKDEDAAEPVSAPDEGGQP
jgi:pyruvate-ferredoxin/flavodoxin oxidoreductase